MISFKQYLAEKWSDYAGKGYHHVIHHDTIGGHRVEIAFTSGGKDHSKRKYNVDFAVNGRSARIDSLSQEQRRKIGLHLHRRTKEFMRKYQPNSMGYSISADGEEEVQSKQRNYDAALKRLGAKSISHHKGLTGQGGGKAVFR